LVDIVVEGKKSKVLYVKPMRACRGVYIAALILQLGTG
jgi:hypothetical protein